MSAEDTTEVGTYANVTFCASTSVNAPPDTARACRSEFERSAAGQDQVTAALLTADRAACLPLPAEPFEARRVKLVTINSQAAVTAAVERALQRAVPSAEVVRLPLERAQEQPAGTFDLRGRPQLLAVCLPPPRLAALQSQAASSQHGPQSQLQPSGAVNSLLH